jgi:hypothetical protein
MTPRREMEEVEERALSKCTCHLPFSTHTEIFPNGQRSVHSDDSFLQDPETDKRSPCVGASIS